MELHRGTIVSQYTVQALVGRGGMAVVYRVTHNHLGTEHALKVLTTPTADVRARLLLEGRAQSRLRHVNVVSVTDTVELESGLGLVMEYVAGPNLHQLLVRRGLSVEQVDELARGILEGVAAAHDAGLVHRDLKPKNILLAVSGRGFVPKITDFGLAKALEADDLDATRSGVSMGTPPYMAPEQIRDAKTADHRADVFSLGAVLYEMVTGRRAFDGADVFETFVKIQSGAIVAPRVLVPELPERMERAIEGALAVDRERRIASCHDLLRVWTAAEAAEDPSTWDPNLLADARRWIDDEGAPPSPHGDPHVDETCATQVPPDDLGTTIPPEASSGQRLRPRGRTGRGVGRRGALLAVALAVGVGLVGIGSRRIAARSGAAPSLALRFQRISYESTLLGHPDISPDGKSVVYEEGGELFVRRLGGRRPVPITEDFAPPAGTPAFSPDGERIAFASVDGLYVIGATGEAPTRVHDRGFHPAWSPDGARLAFVTARADDPRRPPSGAGASRVGVVDLEEAGAGPHEVGTGGLAALGVTWSPDGRGLAFWTPERDVYAVRLEGGEVVPIALGPSADWCPRFHPSRPELWMLSDRGGGVSVWAVSLGGDLVPRGGGPRAVTRAPLGDARTLALSADGTRFLYDIAAERTSDLWSAEVEARPGPPPPAVVFRDLRCPRPGPCPAPVDRPRLQRPDLAPAGDRVVYEEGGALHVRRVGGERPVRIADDGWQAAFSPDGERVAYATLGGLVVVGAAGESPRRVVEEGTDPAWSPDGRALVYSLGTALEWSSVIASGPLRVVPLTGGPGRDLVADGLGPHWAPVGDRIAFWTSRRELRTVRADGSDERPVEAAAGADSWSPRWSRDGRVLFWVTRRGGATDVWMAAIDPSTGSTGAAVPVTAGVDGEISEIAVAGDGHTALLAFGVDRIRANLVLHALDPASRAVAVEGRPVTLGSNRFVDPSFSPDGSRVVFSSFGVDEHLFVAGADGSGLEVILADDHRNRGPVWSRDEDRIAFYSDRSGRYDVWSVRPDGSDLRLHTAAARSGSYEPAWGPGGLLSVIPEEGGVRIIHPDGAVEEPGELRFAPRWSPGGGRVAGAIAGMMSVAERVAWARPTVLAPGSTPRWLTDDDLLFRSLGGLVWHVPSSDERRRVLVPGSEEQLGSFDVSAASSALVVVLERPDSDPWLAEIDLTPPSGW